MILFFLDLLVLLFLSYFFLEKFDERKGGMVMATIFLGIAVCSILLIYIVVPYLRSPF